MRLGWSAKDSFNRTLWAAYATSLVYLFIYILIYWFEPFSEFWNNFYSNFFLQFVALVTASIGVKIWHLYDKTDAPRRVWTPFMIGLWLWFAAEIAWGVINMTRGEVPVGLPDVFWITSYILLAFALYWQYVILFQPTKGVLLRQVGIGILCLTVLTLLVYGLIRTATGSTNTWQTVVNSFYPVMDILLAVVALWLARNFAGGAFARPWIGLLVFSFADLIYAWLEISGMYSWSVDQGNLLTTVADVAYLAAYLVMGVGLFYQWLFLKYGMRPR